MHQEDGSEQWIADFDAKTGIDLELDFIDNNEYTKKLELAYASDTVPDTFDLNGETLGNYAAQGAIADLTDLVHESGLYDKVDKNLWDALTVNGKIYGVPRETPSAIVTYVRKDWLDRLGMDVPTTYDEFIEMLTRFKNEIPECTAPYTAPGLKSTQALPEFYQGATADYVKVDGKWVDGMAQDNMLTALQNLQDAYTAGLIDQEAITNTTSSCRDEWYAGTVGCFPYWGGLWGETLTVRLKQNVPDAEVIALPPIEGATYLYSAPSVQVISSKLSDEQVASVYKYFIEYIESNRFLLTSTVMYRTQIRLPDICVSCISNADYLRITTCTPCGISTQPICCRKAPANRWRHPCWVMRIRHSWSAPTATRRMWRNSRPQT